MRLNYWAHAPQQEKPPQWDTRAPKHNTCFLKLEKAYMQQWIPCADKNKYIQFFESQVSVIIEVLNFPGEGNGDPLQYSYLENHMDEGSW